MAMKKQRLLVLDGQTFQWKFKAHKDHLTRYGCSPMTAHVAVHVEGKPGRLVAYLKSNLNIPPNEDIRCGASHKARFTPGDVKHLITKALEQGWDLESKTQFEMPSGVVLTDHNTVEKA